MPNTQNALDVMPLCYFVIVIVLNVVKENIVDVA
jgi:hypothetical protein